MVFHKAWYFLNLLLPYKLLRPDLFRQYESKLITNSRQFVYESLVKKGFMAQSNGSIPQDMMFMTFERCGIVARELESALTGKLGYKAFEFTNLHGHYGVKSKCSGLIYDLVSNAGVSVGNEGDIHYANYLKAKSASNQPVGIFLKEYLSSNVPTDGYIND